MKKINKKIKILMQKYNYFGVYMVLLVVSSLIPLLIAGRYNVLMADDYAIGKKCHFLWEETHSLLAMFEYAIKQTFTMYQSWRGSYTINFFDTLNPAFFGESLAFITPIIMLVVMLGALFLFVRNLLFRYYFCTKEEMLTIFGVLSLLCVQTMPAPVEAWYWYASAVAYTFLHFLMLLLFCMVWKTEQISNKYLRALCGILSAVYAFFIGGSQYITVLQCVLWYMVFLLLEHRNLKSWNVLPGIMLVVGFAINLLAPGNGARRLETDGLNPIAAILQSFNQAIQCGTKWLSPIVVISIGFLIPVVWKILRKQKTKYAYRYPVIVLLGSYCIFSAAFTPSLYGVGNADAGRIQNLIQSVFYILLFFNLFYIIGWLQRKTDNAKEGFFVDVRTMKAILGKYNWIYSWIMFLGILLVLVGTGDKNTFASVSALRSLVNGEIETYYAEAQERLEIYKDSSVKVVEIEAFTVQPKVLYFTDIVPEGHVNYWINENIAEYYGKEKVVLKEAAD